MAEVEFSEDPQWAYPHDNDKPCDSRAVSVLILHKDGKYGVDIGRFYGKDGWGLQTFQNAAVVGWANLPDFVDETEIIEHE